MKTYLYCWFSAIVLKKYGKLASLPLFFSVDSLIVEMEPLVTVYIIYIRTVIP